MVILAACVGGFCGGLLLGTRWWSALIFGCIFGFVAAVGQFFFSGAHVLLYSPSLEDDKRQLFYILFAIQSIGMGFIAGFVGGLVRWWITSVYHRAKRELFGAK